MVPIIIPKPRIDGNIDVIIIYDIDNTRAAFAYGQRAETDAIPTAVDETPIYIYICIDDREES